jgi:hypothetical protein
MPVADKESPLGGWDHPEPRRLGSFLRGQLSRTEVRDVVRHLLTGCPRCREVTRRLWMLGDLTPPDPDRDDRASHGSSQRLLHWRDRTMTEAEAAAQAELREIIEVLGTLCARLESLHEKLPVPPQEAAMLVGEEEMDVATEVRSVIECVLHDSLQPTLRDLQEAASYRPKDKKRG